MGGGIAPRESPRSGGGAPLPFLPACPPPARTVGSISRNPPRIVHRPLPGLRAECIEGPKTKSSVDARRVRRQLLHKLWMHLLAKGLESTSKPSPGTWCPGGIPSLIRERPAYGRVCSSARSVIPCHLRIGRRTL